MTAADSKCIDPLLSPGNARKKHSNFHLRLFWGPRNKPDANDRKPFYIERLSFTKTLFYSTFTALLKSYDVYGGSLCEITKRQDLWRGKRQVGSGVRVLPKDWDSVGTFSVDSYEGRGAQLLLSIPSAE